MRIVIRGTPWDERPAVIAVARRVAGQVALCAICAVLLLPALGRLALPVSLVLFCAGSNPAHRRAVFSVLAVALCGVSLGGANPLGRLPLCLMAAVAIYAAALWLWVRYLPVLPSIAQRHPLPLLHGVGVGAMLPLILVARWGWVSPAVPVALTALLPELLWRGSYWVNWGVRQRQPVSAAQFLFTLVPFLGRGGVPYGKGPEYVCRFEASDDRQLAAARLRAVRLLLLAALWRALASLLLAGLHGQATPLIPGLIGFPAPLAADPLLPGMDALLGGPALFPLWQRWAALFAGLAQAILNLASYGHSLVAIYCLAGFRIPRNTQAPLFATTLLDFWARYYFYFKELLMDFFFFPVYLRLKGLSPLLRTLLATVAAAFAGNLYYHLILYAPEIVRGSSGGFTALAWQRVVYCSLLAGGLCLSFGWSLRRPSGKPRPWLSRAFGMILAATFFALLHVWNFGGQDISLRQRADLFTWLFL